MVQAPGAIPTLEGIRAVRAARTDPSAEDLAAIDAYFGPATPAPAPAPPGGAPAGAPEAGDRPWWWGNPAGSMGEAVGGAARSAAGWMNAFTPGRPLDVALGVADELSGKGSTVGNVIRTGIKAVKGGGSREVTAADVPTEKARFTPAQKSAYEAAKRGATDAELAPLVASMSKAEKNQLLAVIRAEKGQ